MDKKGKGWDGQKAQWVGRLRRSDGKITVGVCAREKKARSKHMEAITSRLNRDKFEVIVFGDACIMEAPVEEWPLCDCLVAFYSHGFPSDKAKAYVKLRRPYALNNLEMQDVLHDRRKVYDLLESQGVPHPENVYASRDGYGGQKLEELDIVEADDYIQVNSVTVHKPFVEKPVDAENHNVYIYYPMSAGGGSKRLFRKIEDRSSEFYPDVNEIRREGSFVYESFVETQGTDVKVYTVGPDYGHAEARKSPTLDGKVNRNAEGKEIRYPVILTSEEKEYARKITLAFRQCVCGFDILRVQGRSFVCDVNGWSFVKNSRKYVDDCAMLLQEFIDAAVKPSRRTKLFSTEAPLIKYQSINMAQHPHQQHQHQQHQQQDQYQPQQPLQPLQQPLMPSSGGRHVDNLSRINTSVYNGTSGSHRLAYLPLSPDSSIDSTPGGKEVGGGGFAPVGTPPGSPPRSPSGEGRLLKHQRKHPEELRAVIAITRHGDRTPKQKMKMKISFPEFLAFYNKYSPGPRKEIKVKGKLHLKEFLGITVNLINTLRIASTPSSSSSSNGQPPERKKAKTGGPAGGDGAGGTVGVPPPTSAAATPSTTAEQKAVAWSTEPPASGTGETTGTAKEEDSAMAEEGSGSAAGAATKPASALGTPREPPPPPSPLPPPPQQQQQQPAEPTFTEVDAETFGKLTQIKHVLERWEISGFNRKLQLKPRKWVEVDESTLSPEPEQRDRKKPKKAGKKAAAVGATKAGAAAAGRSADEHHDTISKGAGAARRSDGGGDTLRKGAEEGPWEEDATEGGAEGKKRKPERASQLLLILKWGGELTNLGQRQAIELGNSFRTIMYPDAGAGGLLRLHSTFRHDLKIKTSDEGRVMKTAAAFAKGFLELEGDLTPILVSLVSKESSKNSSVMMLDPSGNKNITKDMDRSKDFLQRVMAKDVTFTPELIKSVVPTGQASVRRALRSVGNPVAKLTHLRELVMVLVKQLSRRSARFPLALGANDRVSAADRELDRGIEADEFATSRVEKAEAREKEKKLQKLQQSCDPSHLPATSKDRWDSKDNMLPVRGETPLLMHDRWRKLHDELYDSATGFDITKIPDVHDNVRYDCLHNSHLGLDGLPELYDLAKQLADSIVPQEYGITKGAKLVIGSKMCHALLDKIKYDLLIAMMDSEVDMRYQLDLSHVHDLPINSLGRRVRTRLYFTSESHLHTLLNVLRFPIGDREAVVTDEAKRMLSRTKELCYLTSFVIRLFEDAEKGPEDPARFRVEILFSPGVVKHPMLSGDHLHTAPLVPLHKHLTCKMVLDTLNAAIDLPSTVPDDHSEAEAILHKLDKAARQQRNKESGGGGGGGGSDASTVGAATEGGGGAAAASAPGGSEHGDDGGSSSHTGGREKQRKKQPCQPGGGGGGEGDMTRWSGGDQQQRGPAGEREEEEDASGERQSWYYGGGGGWGRGKADIGGDAAAAEAANAGTKGRKEEDKEKEKEKENETRPRKNSWLSLKPVTRATSRERKPREEQLPEQQHQQQQQQPQQQPQQQQQPQLLRRQDSRDKGDGGAADGGRPDGRSTARNGGVPPAGGANADSRESQNPPEQQQKQEQEEEEEEEQEVADEEGYHPDTGGDQEDGEEDDDDGDGTGEEEDEEEEEDGDGEGDDDDDDEDDDDDNEGFESDIARSAQARLTSDSYQSLRCESEFFCPDSASSNSHTPDDDDEEDEDTTPMIGLNGRSFRRGRGGSRRHHVPKGSKKRAVVRRSVGVDSRNEDGGGCGGGGEGRGGSGPRYSAATVAALGVLGAAAAGAAVMAHARRR